MQTVQTTQIVQTGNFFFFEVNCFFYLGLLKVCLHILVLLLAMPIGACKPGMFLEKVYNQCPSG